MPNVARALARQYLEEGENGALPVLKKEHLNSTPSLCGFCASKENVARIPVGYIGKFMWNSSTRSPYPLYNACLNCQLRTVRIVLANLQEPKHERIAKKRIPLSLVPIPNSELGEKLDKEQEPISKKPLIELIKDSPMPKSPVLIPLSGSETTEDFNPTVQFKFFPDRFELNCISSVVPQDLERLTQQAMNGGSFTLIGNFIGSTLEKTQDGTTATLANRSSWLTTFLPQPYPTMMNFSN